MLNTWIMNMFKNRAEFRDHGFDLYLCVQTLSVIFAIPTLLRHPRPSTYMYCTCLLSRGPFEVSCLHFTVPMERTGYTTCNGSHSMIDLTLDLFCRNICASFLASKIEINTRWFAKKISCSVSQQKKLQ